jgi:hypothetical protein
MSVYAHVKDGTVVNVSVWDGTGWTPPADVTMVLVSESDEPEPGTPGIGWDYVDGTFVDNRPDPDDE